LKIPKGQSLRIRISKENRQDNGQKKKLCLEYGIFNIYLKNNDIYQFTVPYGTWYDYELGMEQAEKDYPGMIFTCYYEDMKKVS